MTTKRRTHEFSVPVTVHFFEPITREEARKRLNAANIGRYLERDAQGATGFNADAIEVGKARRDD